MALPPAEYEARAKQFSTEIRKSRNPFINVLGFLIDQWQQRGFPARRSHSSTWPRSALSFWQHNRMNDIGHPRTQWTGVDDRIANVLAVAQIGAEHTEAMRRARGAHALSHVRFVSMPSSTNAKTPGSKAARIGVK